MSLLFGIGEDVRVVERALADVAAGVDQLPRRAGVVGAEQAAVLVLDAARRRGSSRRRRCATPILPSMPCGRPGLRVISVHVSPPSVDLNRPLPGPPLDIWYSTRYASHIAANITFGFVRSIATSTAPVLSSRNSTFFQVLPPSVVLKTPRSSLSLP